MRVAKLTRRQAEITELVAWGSTQKDVANMLGICANTVDNHLQEIYIRTGVRKMNELAAWWFCTQFNIRFNLSPLARRSIATMLFCLFCYGEYITTTDDYTVNRNARRRTKTEYRLRRSNSRSNKTYYA